MHNRRALAHRPVAASGSKRLTLRQIISPKDQAARLPRSLRSVRRLCRQHRGDGRRPGHLQAALGRGGGLPVRGARRLRRRAGLLRRCGAALALRFQGLRPGQVTTCRHVSTIQSYAAPSTPPAAAAPQHDAAAPSAAADRPRVRAAGRAGRAFCARARAARSSAALAAAPVAAAAQRASSAARASAAAERARSAARAACARPGGVGRRLARRGRGRGRGGVSQQA